MRLVDIATGFAKKFPFLIGIVFGKGGAELVEREFCGFGCHDDIESKSGFGFASGHLFDRLGDDGLGLRIIEFGKGLQGELFFSQACRAIREKVAESSKSEFRINIKKKLRAVLRIFCEESAKRPRALGPLALLLAGGQQLEGFNPGVFESL